MKANNWTRVLWIIYVALLAVLLPHTAWAFSHFEPAGAGWFSVEWGRVTAIAAAFAFEAAIAAFTHKLAKHIERTPRYTTGRVWWRKFVFRYLNAYSIGLFVAVAISAMANAAHAVEYGGTLRIFGDWGVPFAAYAVAFGGILPLCSLLFARVLSNVADTEEIANPELDRAKEQIGQLRKELREAEGQIRAAEARAQAAEQRFGAAGDLFVKLFGEEKRQRILAASEIWPALPYSVIAAVTESSPSYVSEVLKEPEYSEQRG